MREHAGHTSSVPSLFTLAAHTVNGLCSPRLPPCMGACAPPPPRRILRCYWELRRRLAKLDKFPAKEDAKERPEDKLHKLFPRLLLQLVTSGATTFKKGKKSYTVKEPAAASVGHRSCRLIASPPLLFSVARWSKKRSKPRHRGFSPLSFLARSPLCSERGENQRTARARPSGKKGREQPQKRFRLCHVTCPHQRIRRAAGSGAAHLSVTISWTLLLPKRNFLADSSTDWRSNSRCRWVSSAGWMPLPRTSHLLPSLSSSLLFPHPRPHPLSAGHPRQSFSPYLRPLVHIRWPLSGLGEQCLLLSSRSHGSRRSPAGSA